MSEKTKPLRSHRRQPNSDILAANSARLDYQAAAHTQAWIEWLATHAQYAVTLQTRIDSDGFTDAQLDRKRQLIVKELNWLLTRLNQALTGKGWYRKPEMKPLFAATIQTGLIRGDSYSMLGERKPCTYTRYWETCKATAHWKTYKPHSVTFGHEQALALMT